MVATGPGNSVSAHTCGDASGLEAYSANPRAWQIFVTKAWTRVGADKELDCPDPSQDYPADSSDISRPANSITNWSARASRSPGRYGR